MRTKQRVRGITLAGEKEESGAWVASVGINPPPEKAAAPSNWLAYIAPYDCMSDLSENGWREFRKLPTNMNLFLFSFSFFLFLFLL